MTRRPVLLPLAAALALLPAAGAHASTTTFKVVSATHSSSSVKSADGYTGRSTASWKLAGPSRVTVSSVAGTLSGMGRIRVRGQYTIDATTPFPGHCAWTAGTGDAEHPLVAPAPFDLAVGPDAKHPGRVAVGYLGVAASLGNAYLGTECSTDLAGEPDGNETMLTSVAPSAFRAKRVTLRFAGATDAGGISYRWATRIVLQRVKA